VHCRRLLRLGGLGLLFDGTPLLAVGRDDFRQDVLRRIAVACRLDAKLGHEAYAVEVGEFGNARRLRRLADVLRLNAAGAFEDRAQPAPRDVGGLLVPVSRSGYDHERPKLTLGVFTLDDGELGVQAFRLTIPRTLQKSVFAGMAGTKVHLDDDNRAVGDNVEASLSACLIIVHFPYSFAFTVEVDLEVEDG
jgi:hypothetical protein